MNTTDLYLEYARVIKMCDGTDVNPWLGFKWKYKHETNWHTLNKHPNLAHCGDGDMIDVAFAVAILEGKPVFVGDEVYYINGNKIIVSNGEEELQRLILFINQGKCSWTPPSKKRTFPLNGVELPCPAKVYKEDMWHTQVFGNCFYFHTKEDYVKVSEALINLLTEARDKS